MAYCPRCKDYISPKYIFTDKLDCPSCHTELQFEKEEYKQVTRPGIYIAIFIVSNTMFVHEVKTRFVINVVLLVLWFIFFKRYIKYLNNTWLEVKDESV